MKTQIGINGFGRIGRLFFRASLKEPRYEVAAINDVSDPRTLAFLLKHDSVHGRFDADIEAGENALIVNGRKVRVYNEKFPENIPWKENRISLVVEASGRFTDRDAAEKHIRDTVRKVIISAPAKKPDLTVVMGINEINLTDAHRLISNASCTTNCLAPLIKVLMPLGIRQGSMTTIHSYTNDQRILDSPHKDLRRARTAGISMIPTSTGAAKAIGEVIPEVQGKLEGMAIRVPTPNVSLVDLVIEVEKDTSETEVNRMFKEAANGSLKGILEYTEEPVVSVDMNGNPHSSILDSSLTRVINKRMVKVISWYDNEWGFSCRLKDLLNFMIEKKFL
ncbi:MAG TPA: type I glyceraldehyde-3-phosphate dehydrogenase [Nitrospiria bacterium]|nr:type I glyceraldehyde-3-phosphate dehydrogenase [Nitrospiria bacterium]